MKLMFERRSSYPHRRYWQIIRPLINAEPKMSPILTRCVVSLYSLFMSMSH